MMSTIIRDLRRRYGSGARIAWFCFDPRRWGPADWEETDMSRAVIIALTTLLCSDIIDDADQAVRHAGQVLRKKPTATAADLSQILRDLGTPTGRVFLLFDSVETATEDVRARLIPKLQDLQASLGLNIFAAALLGAGIDELFPRSISLEIRASTEDVSSYLHHGLQSDPRLRRLVGGAENDSLRQQIVQNTVNKTDGMLVGALLFPTVCHLL